MTKASKPADYQTLNDELQAILAKLQDGELSIDEALPAYERGMQLVAELEKHITAAQNAVSELQAKQE